MNPKIINSNRYKKTTVKEIKKKKANLKNVNRKVNVKNNKSRKKDKKNQAFRIIICIAILFVIGILSKKIVKLEDIPLVKVFFNDDNKDFVKNYSFKIGINNIDCSDIKSSKNITLSELARMSNFSLIEFDEDYKINYIVAKKITTTDNQTFLVELNDEYKIVASDIKNCIENLLNLSETSIYYSNLKNINSIDIIDNNTLNISLKEKDAYFVYSLNFPLFDNNKKLKSLYTLSECTKDFIKFTNNKSNEKIESVVIKNYTSDDELVEDFRNQNIDMFTTTSENTINLIGKYEYSIKKVRNGESIFLLGNKESTLFSKKEVRQALAYSLNREELVKKISNSFGEVIDLPYIFSKTSYKYDTYAASNVLSAKGWKKAGGIYTLNNDGNKQDLVLKVLVNKDDQIKVKLAYNLKEMLEKNSIKLDIQFLSESEIIEKISNKDYDLVLANVNMNENPDISYIKDYLSVNDNVKSYIEDIENNTDIDILSEKILNLQKVLSEEIACIGICAYDTDIIYQKYIVGFEDLKYLNIFNEFNSIGKAQKID